MKYTVKTESGSVYKIDTEERTVLRTSGGGHYSGRACGSPRKYTKISEPRAGERMAIYWGAGRDEFSPDDGYPDEARSRWTDTSRVVEVLSE